LILYIYSIHINKVLFICLFYKLVSFRGLHKLRPRPDWSLLGFKFKISDEHPRPLHMGFPPPPGYFESKTGENEVLYHFRVQKQFQKATRPQRFRFSEQEKALKEVEHLLPAS